MNGIINMWSLESEKDVIFDLIETADGWSVFVVNKEEVYDEACASIPLTEMRRLRDFLNSVDLGGE